MSYDYRRTTTRAVNRPGRRNYLPPPPPSRQQHSVLGYWVPLVVTGTLALGGLAAWIWSERSEHDEDDRPYEKPPRPQTGVGAPYPTQGSQPYPGPPSSQTQPGAAPQAPYVPPPGGEASSYYNQRSETRDVNTQEDATWYGRVTGVVKRTPSPQQLFDSATKGVSAGVAAAGAALGSIMEGSDEEMDGGKKKRGRNAARRERVDDGFSDQEHWSEEADERTRVSVEEQSERRIEAARSTRESGGKRKAVAIVVSAANADADTGYNNDSSAEFITEHASILSHLPTSPSPSSDLFILIYAPNLTSLPPLTYNPHPTSTLGSSYSAISTPAATPASEYPPSSPTDQFNALYAQALTLVPAPTYILPFTSKTGYVSLLRHLAPSLVYISDALAEHDEGDGVKALEGWVGHTVLVAGDGGVGGLADTETEDEGGHNEGKTRRWYDDAAFVGLGKGVEVVDAARVGEDWKRRVVDGGR